MRFLGRTTIGFNDNLHGNEGGVIDRYVADKRLSDLDVRLAAEGLPKKINQKTLVYDPEKEQILIGDSAGNPMPVSSIKIVSTLDDLPVAGLGGILYVAISDKAFAVWDSGNNAYVKMASDGSGNAVLEKSVEMFPSVENFPLEGEKNKLYLTGDGKCYFYADGKYQQMFEGDVDAYTKREADAKFVQVDIVNKKADADAVYTKTEVDGMLKTVQTVKGDRGESGKSAYDLAVENGFKGTEVEWLSSLKGKSGADGVPGQDGKAGKSAYDIAVANGFAGNQTAWLESLKGESGKDAQDGKSAYDIAVENGFVGNEKQWLESLVGAPGESGKDAQDGKDGKSAYEIAVENGFTGTEAEWLDSLKGEKGEGVDASNYYDKAEIDQKIAEAAAGGEVDLSGYAKSTELADKADKSEVYTTAAADEKFATKKDIEAISLTPGEQGPAGKDGRDGAAGKSAYDIAVKNGFAGTEKEWLESLKGEAGTAAEPVDTSKFAQKSDLEGLAKAEDIPDVSNLATKEDIPDVSNLATKDDIPDVSELAKKSDIPDTSNLATKDDIPDLTGYAKTEDIPKQKTLAELGGVTQAGVESIIQAKDFTSTDVVRQMIADAIAKALEDNGNNGNSGGSTPSDPEPTPSEPVEQPSDSDWAWTRYFAMPVGRRNVTTDMDTFFNHKFNHPDDFVGVGEDMVNTKVEIRAIGTLREDPCTKPTVYTNVDHISWAVDFRKTWKDGLRVPIDGFADLIEYKKELDKLSGANMGWIEYDGECILDLHKDAVGCGMVFMIRETKDGVFIPEYSIGEKIA